MSDLPPAVVLYDSEAPFTDGGLDYDYIAGLGADIAALLAVRSVAECVYQPGDGTSYPLVFVPLVTLKHCRPRVSEDGWIAQRHAVSGVKSRSESDDDAPGYRFYEPNGYLIAWVEHACYPLRLGGRDRVLAGSYVAEHWDGTSLASGVSLAILFRAISFELDRDLSEEVKLQVVR